MMPRSVRVALVAVGATLAAVWAVAAAIVVREPRPPEPHPLEARSRDVRESRGPSAPRS